MSSKITESMPCPNCGATVARGDYLLHVDGERKFVAPDDVQCTCWQILRVMVPIFAVGAYGWVWKIIMPEQRRPPGKPLSY